MGHYDDHPWSEVSLRVCRVVQEQPGIHFRGLARAANLSSVGQLRHHLDRLVRRGILVELEDGGYKRFFLAGNHEPGLRPALALFARRVPRRIGTLLLVRPMSRTELRRSLGCADSTLGFHLSRMVQAQVVVKLRERNGSKYALADAETVRKVMLMRSGGVKEPTVPLAQEVPVPDLAAAANGGNGHSEFHVHANGNGNGNGNGSDAPRDETVDQAPEPSPVEGLPAAPDDPLVEGPAAVDRPLAGASAKPATGPA
ncbi:MAG TPA: ArsR family transcriptional regulator [Candidatus Thermoplasmatota archaeon]|nr:ArsR family transcriptional regulator [Candidatus Thermoplasmatota archaeon]